jgi:cytoskeletal protein CcmA (bactofilin family)
MTNRQPDATNAAGTRNGLTMDRTRPALVDHGQFYFGDVASGGTIRILGHLEGDIRADAIIVALSATVEGGLRARTVHVDGTVDGPIVADRVVLGPTARIKGSISYETANIARGARVSGFCLDRTRQDSVSAGRESTPARPFNRLRTGRSAPDAAPQGADALQVPARRTLSMKAVWRAYQEGRTSG